MIEEKGSASVDHHIAKRVRELRTAKGLSLDGLAGKSGVSRSMISLIERGESSATAAVLDKLATGLGTSLPSLFDTLAAAQVPNSPVARHADQSVWQDPESGYRRRHVSPQGVPQPMHIVEVHFPAGRSVGFENGSRGQRFYQQIWMLEGTMDIRIGAEQHRLNPGDCLAMELGLPTMFHNPTPETARYAVVIAADAPAKR